MRIAEGRFKPVFSFFCFEKRFLRSASLLWFFKAGEDGRRGLGKAHQRIQSVKMEMNVGRMYSISTLKDCLVNKFFFVKKRVFASSTSKPWRYSQN